MAADGVATDDLPGTKFPLDGLLSWPLDDDSYGWRRIATWTFGDTRVGPVIAVPLYSHRLASGALIVCVEPELDRTDLEAALSFARQAALAEMLRAHVASGDPDVYDTILNRIYVAGMSLAELERSAPPSARIHIDAVARQLDLVVHDVRRLLMGDQ